MSACCASFEMEFGLELGVFLVRSSFLLLGSPLLLGRSGAFPCSIVTVLVEVLLNE